MFYCLSRYTFVHPLLRYLLLLHLLQLFGNFKCCFLDRIAAKLLIGFTTNRWKWNEWSKHPNFCFNVLIHCCFELPHFGDKKHFVTIRFMGENIQIMAIWWENKGYIRLRFFLTLLCLQFSVTLVKQRGRTFALKIRFEQNDSIAPPYQFKREDMRLNLHC